MKIVKLVLISIVFFFLLITIISLFLPSQIRLSKTIEIKCSKEKVLAQLSEPANWRSWYPGMDSAKLFYLLGVPMGLITNEKEQRAIVITEKKNDEVAIEYTVSGKRKILGGWKITEPANKNSVIVQWYTTFHVGWLPWKKFAGMVFERSFSDQMRMGLVKLKEISEAK